MLLKLIVRIVSALSVSMSLSSISARAGAVNSPEGFPLAAMNAMGDYLIGGDLKVRISWQGRSSTLTFPLAKDREELFTGGIATDSNEISLRPRAIACSESRAALFFPQRSRNNPGGYWQELRPSHPFTHQSRLRCAMLNDGSYLVYRHDRREILMPDGLVVPLPPFSSPPQLIAAGKLFVALGDRQSIALIETTGKVTHQVSSLATGEEFTRYAGNTHGVMRADGSGVKFARWVRSEDNPSELQLGQPENIPIAPCSETQACAVSLAEDGSWVVSGYWGTFLGMGTRSERVRLAHLSRETAGVAFAHQSADGLFVYLGNDDGDFSSLRTVLGNSSPSDREAPPTAFSPHRGFAWEDRADRGQPIDAPLSSAFSGEGVWWAPFLGRDVGWSEVARARQTPAQVKVALIDSGIETTHPGFAGKLCRSPEEIPGNGQDDDDNGFVDDEYGFDFVEENGTPQDEFWHGTHVAGLVASLDAEGNELGIAPNACLIVLRALDGRGKSNSIDVGRAVLHAIERGAEVINLSWGGGPATQVVRDVIRLATERNISVISSAGNDALNTDRYPQEPKSLPGVITVGGLNSRGRLAKFSNFGANSVTWLLPGADVLSTLPGNSYGEKSGTSMAAPLGAGMSAWILGLLKEKYPDWSRAKWKETAEELICQSGSMEHVASLSRCGKVSFHGAVTQALGRP